MDYKKIIETEDHTSEFTDEEKNSGKVMALLSYIGLLILIPFFAEKENKFVKFHINQGAKILIADIAFWFITLVFNIIRGILIYNTGSTLLSLVTLPIVLILDVIGIGFLVLMILGIVNAYNGKAQTLPLTKYLKFNVVK